MSDEAPRFKPAKGLPGLVFVPPGCGRKKHPCPDCFECQWCSDSRCQSCRGTCKARRPGEEGAGPDEETK